MNGYIGVNGKARSIKAVWAGVDGKARKVQNAYVGVNGKARRWFGAAAGCRIRAGITYRYPDPDILGLLRIGPEEILLGSAPDPEPEVTRAAAHGTLLAVGYLDQTPYGPMNLYVYLDGKSVPVSSAPCDPGMDSALSAALPVDGSLNIEFVFESTGGSMPMNTMTVHITHTVPPGPASRMPGLPSAENA